MTKDMKVLCGFVSGVSLFVWLVDDGRKGWDWQHIAFTLLWAILFILSIFWPPRK